MILGCGGLAARTVTLRARCVVGRSRSSGLCLQEPLVSGEHACITFRNGTWTAHDLGSRNGTFIDDKRLALGERAILSPQQRIGFGSTEQAWTVLDVASPVARACTNAGDWVIGAPGWLVLPSGTEPPWVVFYDAEGRWWIEADGEPTQTQDGATVYPDGIAHRLFLPSAGDVELLASTACNGAPGNAALHTGAITLCFEVSRDEEFVSMSLRDARGDAQTLGARVHAYMLLTLARRRLSDAQLPAGERGWVHVEDLANMLAITRERLNVDVYRARRQFAKAGLLDASQVIERRASTGQLRLGIAGLEIERM